MPVLPQHCSCPLCPGTTETILHRFWGCDQAQATWEWCSALIHAIQRRPSDPTVHFNMDWHHCIFSQSLPRRFGKFSNIWSLLRGLALWTIWIARNARCFSNDSWSHDTIAVQTYYCEIGTVTLLGNRVMKVSP